MTAPAATHRTRLPLWVVVVAGGVITSVSLGVRATFGLLLEPIADGLGTELGPIALAVAVQNLLWGVSQPIAGALSDRFGAPPVLAAGGALYALSMLLMATAESSGMILLSGGFLTGIAVGAASFAVVLSTVGKVAPPEQRSMLLGVVSAVGSLGQFVMIPIARVMLDSGSWERASVVLAMVLVAIVLVAPLMRIMRISDVAGGEAAGTDSGPTLRADLRKAQYARPYLLLNAAFFVCGFHVTYIGVHLAGYAKDVGLSPSIAATALALIGLFNVVGSLLVGWLGQRYSLTKLLAGIYGLRAVVIGVYVVVPVSGVSTTIFAMAMGVLWLSTVPPTGAMVQQQFGPKNSGALFGIVFFSHQVGSFLGAWLGGELFDATGSYTAMWWTAVALGVFAMTMHLLITEGPVADPPTGARRLRIAAVGAVVVLVSAAVWASMSVAPTAADLAAEEPEPVVSFCVLGPMLHGGGDG